jgi:hypothetical protein
MTEMDFSSSNDEMSLEEGTRETNILFTQESTDDKELEVVNSPRGILFLPKNRGKKTSEESDDEMDVDSKNDSDEDVKDDDPDDYDSEEEEEEEKEEDEEDDDVDRIDDTFESSGRDHHNRIPPGRNEFHFYGDKKYYGMVKTEWGRMNGRIDACSEEWEKMRDMIDSSMVAKTCEEVLEENPKLEKFYDDIEKGVYRSIDEWRKRVMHITKKPLEYFHKKGSMKHKHIKLRLAHRMLKYLCNHCYYCKGIISVKDVEEWYGVHFEHLPGKGEKKFDIMMGVTNSKWTVGDHRKEVRKCATVCFGCNPKGEHGKKRRKYPIDRRYLPENLDLKDRKHVPVKTIIEQPVFQKFLHRAKHMGFLHSKELNQDGTAKGGKIVGTFYDLKMLIWTHFEVLLEDIVYWRKMTDGIPIHLFYIAMTNLIKILCNKCFETGCVLRTRNTPPHRLGEFHFDHYEYKSSKDKDITVMIRQNVELDKLLKELKLCTLRCAKCHRGR